MKKYSTHFLLLLFSLSALSFSQGTTETGLPGAENYHLCDPSNSPQTCNSADSSVCGYIHDCAGSTCTNTFTNKCSACTQENVDGYVEGSCEEIQTNCPETRPDMCPLIWTATCGVAGNCEGPHCFEDVTNSCLACTQENAAYSLPGSCPYNDRESRTYCEWNKRPENCTEEYNPVCAHRGNCIGKSCYFTAGNACGACADVKVDYHIPGQCSENEEVRTYCDGNNRPETCAEEFSPVCAHKTDCEGDDCYYTAGNPCTACADSAVDWHSEGKCQNENNNGGDDGKVICNPDHRPRNCDQEQYSPVCAHRLGCEGEVCEYTAANHCSACNDIYVNDHTAGEC